MNQERIVATRKFYPRLMLCLLAAVGGARADSSPPDEAKVSGDAVSLTYDHKAVFVRLAYDRKVNFSHDEQMRLSLGRRFQGLSHPCNVRPLGSSA